MKSTQRFIIYLRYIWMKLDLKNNRNTAYTILIESMLVFIFIITLLTPGEVSRKKFLCMTLIAILNVMTSEYNYRMLVKLSKEDSEECQNCFWRNHNSHSDCESFRDKDDI